MATTNWKDNRVDLSVSTVLKYSDRIMLNAEKCRLEQYHDSLLRADTPRDQNIPKSTILALEACRRCVWDIQSNLRHFQYRDHEETILEELKNISNSINSKYADMDRLELPQITSPGPLKPTTLLERAIEKHRLKKIQTLPAKDFGNVDVITLADGSAKIKLQLLVKTSAGSSVKSKSASSRKSEVPTLRYEHQEGQSRNLPGQPELIRLLFDTELGFKSRGASYEHGGANNFLDLYGSVEPPLIEGIKRKAKRRRKVVCKFCGKRPGCHQKWCVYYEAEPEPDFSKFELVRSNTDIDFKPINFKKPNSFLERSRTTLEKRHTRPDLPDYSSLHRDVYNHALAISRAKRALRGAHDFTNQSTRPYVFSYFSVDEKCCTGSKTEMEHIFGKEDKDFTKYYDLFVKEKQPTM